MKAPDLVFVSEISLVEEEELGLIEEWDEVSFDVKRSLDSRTLVGRADNIHI